VPVPEPARSHEAPIAAGDLSAWLGRMRGALRGEGDSDVPCGECTACCSSAQFVAIGPEESETLRHIPAELLVSAPFMPPGHVLLGHDEHGRCPMLVDGRCSIYDHRPRTCRTYDCRVLAATGLEPRGKPLIARQIRRWSFSHPTAADQVEAEALQAAARYLADRAAELPPAAVPVDVTQRAVLAVAMVDAFVDRDPATGERSVAQPDPDDLGAEILRRTAAPDGS
jgi:uncharacterized protein